MTTPGKSVIALDVGAARIGVAVASLASRLPQPLKTIPHNDGVMEALSALCQEQNAVAIVVGLPRGLDGQHTAQTLAVELFASDLEKQLDIPLYWQDEAVTSAQAEAELLARKKPYSKGDIDALAATYILEDFMQDPASRKLEEAS
jgi:putative holliday junction resolvase